MPLQNRAFYQQVHKLSSNIYQWRLFKTMTPHATLFVVHAYSRWDFCNFTIRCLFVLTISKSVAVKATTVTLSQWDIGRHILQNWPYESLHSTKSYNTTSFGNPVLYFNIITKWLSSTCFWLQMTKHLKLCLGSIYPTLSLVFCLPLQSNTKSIQQHL